VHYFEVVLSCNRFSNAIIGIMEYNEYIETFTLIEEEEVGYLSKIMLDIFVIKKKCI
jgi:hypothetical protein